MTEEATFCRDTDSDGPIPVPTELGRRAESRATQCSKLCPTPTRSVSEEKRRKPWALPRLRFGLVSSNTKQVETLSSPGAERAVMDTALKSRSERKGPSRIVRRAILLAAGLFAVWLLSPLSIRGADPADLVLRGGRIVTMDAALPLAEAVAVIGDRIAAVGKSSDIAARNGPKTRVLAVIHQQCGTGRL